MPRPSTASICRRSIAPPRLRPLALTISVLLLGGGLGGAASAANFPATINLGSLNGSDGFRLDGVAAGDLSGISVSAAGDINGDGLGDLIVGASDAAPNGSYSGSSYVVFGQSTPFAASLALASLNGSNGFRLDGAAAGDRSGRSVSAAGDINGDGIGDLIVGAYSADPNGSNSGSSYVVFGQSTPFAATLALASLDGSNGFRLDGAAGIDLSGISVSAAGDINGDGLGDLIVGAAFADPNGSASGSSYVVFGQSTPFAATLALASLNGSNGFRLEGVAAGDYSGISVSAAGDINGDGLGDLIVGAYFADPNGSNSGSSYVVFGQSTPFAASLSLASLNGSDGFRLDGVAAGDRSGISVSAAGDINGDGLGDLIVGAAFADPNGGDSGSSYVVFGQSTPFAATLALASLNGSNGFRLDGVAVADQSGRSVSAAGDINGDGLGDLIVGAYRASPNGISFGSSYVVYGQSTPFAPALALASLNGSNGFRLDGVAQGDQSGRSVSAAGDINGDGLGDLIVGAFGADPNGDFSGSSYVVYGRPGPLIFSSGFESTPDIVRFDNVNFVPNEDFTGGSIRWIDGVTCDCDTDNFDFNVFGSATSIPFFWPRVVGVEGGVSLDGSTYAVLSSGDRVGSQSDFIATGQEAGTVAWSTPGNVTGYLGFRFEDEGQVKYGYALISTGTNGRPFTLISYAFENSGGPIVIP